MSEELAKRENLPAAVINELQKHSLNFQVGDIILDPRDGGRFRIAKITEEGVDIEHSWNDEWHHYGTITFQECEHRGYVKIDKPIEQVELEVLERMKNLEEFDSEPEENTQSTSLAKAGSKEYYLECEREIVKRKRDFAIMKAVMERKTNELQHYIKTVEKQLRYVRKVLGIVELYMGVHEQIIQIREGQPALPSDPIHIRQQLLFMDEELGDPKDGGLDFQRLEDFDKWVADPVHLEQILPEKRGIVALRVRRGGKDYPGAYPLIAAAMNAENMKTYFLMRNGDNLYRIWSNVTVHGRLFPKKDELETAGFRRRYDGKIEEDPFWSDEKQQDLEIQYKTYGLMIQGILHRTEIFQPIDTEIDVFKPGTWNGRFVLIRDDELQLPSGRKSWGQWRDEINSKIQIGSRIVYSKPCGYWQKDFMSGRVAYGYQHCHPPAEGLYTVVGGVDGETDKEHFRFYYLPSDQVWYDDGWDNYGCRDRRRRVGFSFYLDEVLNYDQISLEDIEFYLSNRTDRHNYLRMIPLLWELKRKRKAELEREKAFVKLVAQRNLVSEEEVWGLIDWWKLKNKWKRPLEEDDAKALRMIERRLRRNA